jgi:hypothetical protein
MCSVGTQRRRMWVPEEKEATPVFENNGRGLGGQAPGIGDPVVSCSSRHGVCGRRQSVMRPVPMDRRKLGQVVSEKLWPRTTPTVLQQRLLSGDWEYQPLAESWGRFFAGEGPTGTPRCAGRRRRRNCRPSRSGRVASSLRAPDGSVRAVRWNFRETHVSMISPGHIIIPPVPECQSASVFRLRYFEPKRTRLRCPSALTIIASGSMRTI